MDGTRGPRFTTWALAIQAAQAGDGVALGSRMLVETELAAGTLVRPFAEALAAPADLGFYLVCPEVAADRPKIRAFCAWMLDTVPEQGRR